MYHEYQEVLTIYDLCDMLQIGKNSAYDLLNKGYIKGKKIGNLWRIPRKAVDDFLIGNKAFSDTAE